MKPIKGQMSESFLLAALLALAGGFLDAYTYLLHGGVFANAQTGNIVLLGLHLAEGRFSRALYYLVPIAAFVLGIVAVELIKRRFRYHPRIHWRQITLAAECIALAFIAFQPAGKWDIVINPTISFLCAMQVETFRKVRGSAFASTMCTGNLRSATELLFLYRTSGDRELLRKALRYYGVILFFIAGAASGAALCDWLAEKAAFVCCILLAAGFFLMFIKEKEEIDI